MLLGEVAPVAALPPIVWLALLLIAFGIVWTVRKLLNALFGWLIAALEKLPVIGHVLAGPFKTAEQAVANALGTAEHAIDASIGASWHLLARYMDWMWREIRGHAALLLQMASLIPGLADAIAILRALVHHGTHANDVTTKRVKVLEREYHGIDRQIRTLQKELRGIDETGIQKKLGTLDKELATIEAQTIPAIQAADSDAAAAISNLYEWAKGKASLLGIGTFATAVAAAIGIDAFRALRCPSFLSSFRKRGCGLFDGIEGLLGLLIDAFFLTEVCDVLPLLDAAVSDVATPLVVALTDVGAGLCAPGSAAPAALTGPAIDPPPVYFDGTLVLG